MTASTVLKSKLNVPKVRSIRVATAETYVTYDNLEAFDPDYPKWLAYQKGDILYTDGATRWECCKCGLGVPPQYIIASSLRSILSFRVLGGVPCKK